MLDLQRINENEVVTIGVKSNDFLDNPLLNEYKIYKSDSGFIISFDKTGVRNQKYSGSIEIEEIITELNSGDRKPTLTNFICENSNIYAVTIGGEFKVRIENVMYYKVSERDGE